MLMNIWMEYLVKNYVLLIMLGGLLLLTAYDVFLDRWMLYKLRGALFMLFSLSVIEECEDYCAHLPVFTKWRIFFSAFGYSLRPIIIMLILLIVYEKVSKWVMVPAVLNVIFSFSAFFTGIFYSFHEDVNTFIRGPLGYAPYVVSAFYVIAFLVVSAKASVRHSREENSIIFFMAFAALGAGWLATQGHDEVVNTVYAAEIALYYLYTYAQYTKRDALTGLFNRQTFYGDMQKNDDIIMGVISIDMNELKWLNDTLGHSAGDKALKTVAECFEKTMSTRHRIYRIGGDEFIILCRKMKQGEMEAAVDKMRKMVDEAGYSCAFGISRGKSAEEMVKEADEYMYEDKARIKAEMKAKGITLHPRNDGEGAGT